jgi:hypothetical protein
MRSASLGFWVDIIDERLGWHPKPKFYEDLGTAREATALHLGRRPEGSARSRRSWR